LAERKGGTRCPLLAIRWDRVILDEGHEIRNRKSKTHVAALELRGPIRWIVTGTPVFNSIRDFVALCAFVGIPKDVAQGYTDRVRDTYVLRRTKVDVARHNARLELPPCDFENLELEMYPEEADLYRDVFDQGQGIVRSIFKAGNVAMHQMELLECLLRVRQVMTWPQMYLDGIAVKNGLDPEPWVGRSRKLETLMDLIKLHPKEKTLVFTQFMGEMDRIQELLTEAGIPVHRIDGSVSKELREERIAAFKAATSAPAPVFLIQVKAGGVGLNLQEATRVYITAPTWNPATELQAIGRAHRTGQTRKVVVRRLVYAGVEEGGTAGSDPRPLRSVEESILQLQEGKAKVCADVLGDPRVMAQVPKSTKMNIQVLKRIFAV
jgi:SNF2 family DNA or RNA helicase